jgi:hypothetical protein
VTENVSLRLSFPPTSLLLSSLGMALLLAVPVMLIAFFFVFRLFRQRKAARHVGVNGTVADAILGGLQQQVQSTLLMQEQVYDRLRQTGEAATAKILTMMDTNIRIGDQASMLRFSVEVFPKNRPSFRADTQNAISDATRQKFMPGSTVYVKFDPRDPRQVALDGAPAERPAGASVLDCPSCGAAQRITNDVATCLYCSRPLA